MKQRRRLFAELEPRERLGLAVLLAVSLGLGFVGLGWGLPNGDSIWSTDALTPMAPLAAAYRLLGAGWNSGWFYYKYPLGHPLLLSAVYAPYLIVLKLTGGLGSPSATYPYGFTDPAQALYVLSLLGRAASAVMTTGAVLFWYLACRELLGWRVAWIAAWFAATMFPVVFYAHTTNVDAALLFWCCLALYGAARVYHRRNDRTGMILFGAAAAMALSTKEYAFGLMLTLALILLGRHLWHRRREGGPWLPSGTLPGVVVSLLVFVVMNGIVVNPLGMWHRVLFLTDSMPEELRLKYAPRFSHVGSAVPKDLGTELAQLGVTLRECADSTNWLVAIAAVAGLLVWGWRSPWLFFSLAAVGYYIASLRSLEMMQVRYVLPLSLLATALAATSVVALARLARPRFGRLAFALAAGPFVLYSAACAIDTSRLLLADTRYEAEAWLAAHAPSASVEVYQRDAYLPRFPSTQQVANVPFEEVSTGAFLARRPDLVVLSSAGLAGVTVRFKNDLASESGDGEGRSVSRRGASGEAMAYEYTRNRAFLDALERGCLGYELAARFETRTWAARATIPSLAPTILVYRRAESAPPAGAGSEQCRGLLAADGEKTAHGESL